MVVRLTTLQCMQVSNHFLTPEVNMHGMSIILKKIFPTDCLVAKDKTVTLMEKMNNVLIS